MRRLDPDVLALQEVDCDQPRSERADLTAAAAEAMGAVEHRFVAAISGTPGATWMAATGHEQPGTAAYGIALLSRFPVASWQVVRLPRIPMRFPMYLPGPNRVMVVNEEPRAAVIAQLHTPLGGLTVANTHLSFVPGWNRRQLRRLDPRPARLPGAAAADRGPQHDARGGAPLVGHAATGGGATFPAETPDRQLDHILTDDHRLRGGAAEAELMPISDHRPLVVDLDRAEDVGSARQPTSRPRWTRSMSSNDGITPVTRVIATPTSASDRPDGSPQ